MTELKKYLKITETKRNIDKYILALQKKYKLSDKEITEMLEELINLYKN